VYVEEVASGSKPIQPVGTSTAGFVGGAPLPEARLNEPVPVDNWSQFKKHFWEEGRPSTHLSHAVNGFFQNGGRRCYVVNIGGGQSLTTTGRARAGLDVLETIDEVKIVAAPGFTGAVHFNALLTHCERLRYRTALFDPPETVASIGALKSVATAAAPPRKPKPGEPPEPAAPPEAGLRPPFSKSGHGAFYFPWITVSDPFTGALVNVPPSGHLAGIYARSDALRGVHKAPANELISGAVNVAYPVTRAEQEELNPAGVNCIRLFSGGDVTVWGARSVADPSSEWRYLNVRRLFNFLEESVERGTNWAVFEPNDRMLWKSLVADVRAFLLLMWRDGALMGRTPEEAFFVQCDEETNPPESIDQGLVVIRVGVAPVKPAEFVVFRIGQSLAGAQKTEEGVANA
jgi:hypothetical protein